MDNKLALLFVAVVLLAGCSSSGTEAIDANGFDSIPQETPRLPADPQTPTGPLSDTTGSTQPMMITGADGQSAQPLPSTAGGETDESTDGSDQTASTNLGGSTTQGNPSGAVAGSTASNSGSGAGSAGGGTGVGGGAPPIADVSNVDVSSAEIVCYAKSLSAQTGVDVAAGVPDADINLDNATVAGNIQIQLQNFPGQSFRAGQACLSLETRLQFVRNLQPSLFGDASDEQLECTLPTLEILSDVMVQEGWNLVEFFANGLEYADELNALTICVRD